MDDGVERSIHYLVVSVKMPWKMGKGLKSKASVLSFFFFLTTFLLLCQFANYANAAASSSSSSSSLKSSSHMHPHSKQLSKRPISFVSPRRQREWRTLSALNSSRNARQVPEIPALYSAPEVLSPETPALYSAPGEINSNDDPNEQNDLDADPQARQATTEITIGGGDDDDDEEEAEASSEDYQYGVPTEKYGMSDDSNQAEEESLNEYPTDSPMPQATYLPPVSRTNDVDFNDDASNAEETTEDSYSGGGYNNDPANEPSQQYGPPAPPQPSRKNGNGKGSNKRKMQSSSSPRRTNNSNKNNGRPSDQQQKMGNRMQQQQPQNQKNNEYDSEPQSAYLPPVYQPPSQPINHQDDYQQEDITNRPEVEPQQQESQEDPYTPSTYGQQPPNVNYHTLPDIEEDIPQQNDFGGSPSYEPNFVDKSANGDNSHSGRQGFGEEERSNGLPDNGGQGQYFGNEQPNSVYGPPGVNHLQSHSNNRDEGGEEELEGLNENIVDAELLERVQQIIEDHERQQKAFLDRVQKDNEKAFGGGGGSSGYSGASGISSFSNENEIHDGFSSRGGGGGGGGSTPYTAYGPPALSNGPSGSGSNGYHNHNSIQQQNNGDQDHHHSQSGNNQNKPSGSYSPPLSSLSSHSQNGGGYNNQRQGKKLDFQVQKAVLSRHFTETEITPSGYSGRKEDGYQKQNKLNSFAGPGEEYLPPASPSQQSGNSGYPNSFNSGNGKAQDHQNVFNVKVGTGIVIDGGSGKPKSTSGSAANQQPSNSYGSPPYSTLQNSPLPSLTSGAPRSQNSQGYNAPRQTGASTFPTAARFPSELPSYQTSFPPQQQQQQQNFQPSTFWSRTHPQHGSPPPPQQQTRYGPPPPPTENRSEKPTTSYQSNTGSNSNKIRNGDHSAVGNGNPSNGDYHQRSYNSPQTQSQQPHSAFQSGGGFNGASEPRPVYGIPLAPVITLDSDNNLSNFNGNSNNVGGGGGGSSQEKNTFSSYSQDDNNAGQSFPVGSTIASGSGPANNYYLPPSAPASGSPSPQNREIGQHQFPSSLPSTLNFPQQESGGSTLTNGDAPSYGLFTNNPSQSSSSTYLMIQGHDGNSNNHIYNINHNGYDTSSLSFARLMSSNSGSGGEGDDSSSIIIPGGISNAFSLPIYDYSPSHHQNHQDELLGSAAMISRPAVVPFKQLLEEHHPQSVTSPGSSSSSSPSTHGNFRVSRRALTRKANVSSVVANDKPDQKPLTSRNDKQ